MKRLNKLLEKIPITINGVLNVLYVLFVFSVSVLCFFLIEKDYFTLLQVILVLAFIGIIILIYFFSEKIPVDSITKCMTSLVESKSNSIKSFLKRVIKVIDIKEILIYTLVPIIVLLFWDKDAWPSSGNTIIKEWLINYWEWVVALLIIVGAILLIVFIIRPALNNSDAKKKLTTYRWVTTWIPAFLLLYFGLHFFGGVIKEKAQLTKDFFFKKGGVGGSNYASTTPALAIHQPALLLTEGENIFQKGVPRRFFRTVTRNFSFTPQKNSTVTLSFVNLTRGGRWTCEVSNINGVHKQTLTNGEYNVAQDELIEVTADRTTVLIVD